MLDFGTSVAAEGKVRVYYINDKAPVPEGWLQDSEGRPTTDPSVLYEPPLGTILPMGGSQAYKGFGLGLVLDMLTGGLSGGATCHPNAPPPRGNNVLFLALDAAQFSGLDSLIRQSECVADYVRSTPRAPGVEAILLPGDPELRTLEHRSAHGIPLEEAHWLRLAELAQRLGVPLPDFDSVGGHGEPGLSRVERCERRIRMDPPSALEQITGIGSVTRRIFSQDLWVCFRPVFWWIPLTLDA